VGSRRVLGIDPGSRATGWALVISEGNRYRLQSAGVVRPKGGDRCDLLADLHRKLTAVIDDVDPDCAAVESSFSGLNPKTGIALAESRGVALAVLGGRGIEVASFSPAQVKSAVVGHGRAEKQQVTYMVERLLGLEKTPPTDAADAMAVAITYLHSRPLAKPR
jgi:crossover junction endodeoxyribonuclease RuvC